MFDNENYTFQNSEKVPIKKDSNPSPRPPSIWDWDDD